MKTRPGDIDKETDAELLGRCDLAHKRDQLSTSLSGGQKRKLQLAIALVGGSDCESLTESMS
jgi:ATP-binding cassette subfamily A (ABC1) protein 3